MVFIITRIHLKLYMIWTMTAITMVITSFIHYLPLMWRKSCESHVCLLNVYLEIKLIGRKLVNTSLWHFQPKTFRAQRSPSPQLVLGQNISLKFYINRLRMLTIRGRAEMEGLWSKERSPHFSKQKGILGPPKGVLPYKKVAKLWTFSVWGRGGGSTPFHSFCGYFYPIIRVIQIRLCKLTTKRQILAQNNQFNLSK